MEKKEQLYEGKAKKVFATDDANLVIVDYKDDATAFNGEKKGTITGKGVINNVMSNHMFQLLEQQGVPTHFVEQRTAPRPLPSSWRRTRQPKASALSSRQQARPHISAVYWRLTPRFR